MKQHLIDTLREIPYMELDIEIDIECLLQEADAANNNWYNYVAPFMTPTNLQLLGIENHSDSKKIYDNYEHCTLITYHPKNHPSIVSETFAWSDNGDMSKITNYYDVDVKDRAWHYTSESLKYPYLMKLVSEITDHPSLCKLIKAKPGNWLGWHSHQADPVIKQYNKPEQCIIHIPIRQHKDVAFLVSKNMPSNRSKFESLDFYKNDPDSYVGSFVPGKAYYFNSLYPHAMKNYSDQDRLDIALYSDTTINKKLEELIERSISKYNGPRIKERL
jgi:hypothetical protein